VGPGIVNDQGITPTKIKIGFILPAGNPGAAFGINSPNSDPNSPRTLVDALVKDVNQRGGIAGRTVEAAYVDNDNTDNSQKTQTDKQEQSCRTLTEGSKVFMAVALNVGGLPFGHACFAREGVPLIDRELTLETDASMAQLSPWVIAPTGMTLTRIAKLLPATLAEQGFLTKSMAVIAYDIPTTRQVTEEVLIPEIQKRGGAVIDKVYSAVSYEDLGRQMSAAVLRFNGKVDRVVFMAPGGGAPLLFTKQADAQRYYPRLGVSTLDCPGPCLTPADASSVPKRSMVGAIGLGYVPLYDTGGYDPWANPTAKMRACWDAANRATGSSYPGPLGTQFVLLACDLLNFAQQALAPAANRTLMRPQVAGQVAAVGSGFLSIFTPKTRFAGDRLAGAAAAAPLRFDDDCGGNGTGCWKYSGPFKDSPF
jgi:ABC-type branched-subunit amino acid transport system substrate-binding protein